MYSHVLRKKKGGEGVFYIGPFITINRDKLLCALKA